MYHRYIPSDNNSSVIFIFNRCVFVRTHLPTHTLQFSSTFLAKCFVSVHVVHPYSSMDTATAWMKFLFILSERSYFRMIDNLSKVIHTFATNMLTPLSADGTLLPRYVKLSTNFRCLAFRVEMAHSSLNTWTLFYLLPRRGLCLLLIALGYAEGILLGLVYLREVLDHLHYMCLL